MTNERYKELNRLYRAALELEPAHRAAYLAAACGSDKVLWQEVESLLAGNPRREEMIDEPAQVAAQAETNQAESTVKSSVGQSLGYYRILSLLGKGGMGEVYLGEDQRLGRKVAIKLLPAGFTTDTGRVRRFEQEARAASALNHPNIITIHEIGEASTEQGATRYIVTEYVEGETLRQRIASAPQNKVADAIDIASQIAAALSAAHESGIMHRDIKPENVMVRPDGIVKVLDFGLAKLTEGAQPAIGSQVSTVVRNSTETGVVIGTPRYMSPEQVRGEKLDARTDIFSLGVLLYELIAGHAPFEGDTWNEVVAAILRDSPRPLTECAPDAPPELEAILSRALRKDRDERYQTAKELLLDLKQLTENRALEARLGRGVAPELAKGTAFAPDPLPAVARDSMSAPPRVESATGQASSSAIAVEQSETGGAARVPTGPLGRVHSRVIWFGGALGLAVIMGATAWFLTKSKSLRGAERFSRQTTVAVLPFQNVARNSEVEYLSTALPDEVITTLSYAPTLSVRPFSMSQQFSAEKAEPHRAGEQLRVSQVITGRFRQQGDRVGITLEATDVATDEIVWHESLDVTSKDVLTLRQELTTALQKGLLPALGVSNVELSRTKPASQEAYELYLRSQDSTYRTMARYKEGIAMLERSIALDPGYAPAWLGLAMRYETDSDFASGGDEMYQKTVAALERARRLDPYLLRASTLLIERRAFYEDLASSFAQIEELAHRRPHTAAVHYVFSAMLRSAGALDRASRECEIVNQLDPEFPSGGCIVTYLEKGDYPKARREIERSPGDFSTMMLGQILLREGKVEEALPKLKSIPAGMGYELFRDCWPDSSTTKCATTARESEASFRAIPFNSAWYFGAAELAFLNKKDGAIRLLRAATEHSLCIYPAVDSDPLFDKIRNSPEFKAVRQAGIDCKKRFAPYAEMRIE